MPSASVQRRVDGERRWQRRGSGRARHWGGGRSRSTASTGRAASPRTSWSGRSTSRAPCATPCATGASPAYLFCGPRGCGKTTTARVLAKAVNCEDPDPAQRPCNACPACLTINAGRAVDIIEIDAASNRGVDDIRDLREKVRFAPAQLRTKFYIIDEVHQLTKDASNALLKTLEEPPHVAFILATTDPERVLETISSRCQTFIFHRIPVERTIERLRRVCAAEGLRADDEALAAIARAATGSLRDALGLLDQLASFGEEGITAETVRQVLGAGSGEQVLALVDALIAGDVAAGLRVINAAVEGAPTPASSPRNWSSTCAPCCTPPPAPPPRVSPAPPAPTPRSRRNTATPWASPRSRRWSPASARSTTASRTAPTATCRSNSASSRRSSPAPPAPAPPPPATRSPPPARCRSAPPPARPPPSRRARPARVPTPIRAEAPAPRAPEPAAPPVERARPVAAPAPDPSPRPHPAPAPIAAPEPGIEPAAVATPPPAAESAPPPVVVTAPPPVTLEQVQDAWGRIRRGVKAVNRRLEAVLASVDPHAVAAGELILIATYDFHRNQLNRDDGRQVVEEVIAQVLGAPFRVTCIGGRDEAAPAPAPRPAPEPDAPQSAPVAQAAPTPAPLPAAARETAADEYPGVPGKTTSRPRRSRRRPPRRPPPRPSARNRARARPPAPPTGGSRPPPTATTTTAPPPPSPWPTSATSTPSKTSSMRWKFGQKALRLAARAGMTEVARRCWTNHDFGVTPTEASASVRAAELPVRCSGQPATPTTGVTQGNRILISSIVRVAAKQWRR